MFEVGEIVLYWTPKDTGVAKILSIERETGTYKIIITAEIIEFTTHNQPKDFIKWREENRIIKNYKHHFMKTEDLKSKNLEKFLED